MYSFKKEQRLLTKRDYEVVFKQAKKIATSEFVFLFRENTVGKPRLGLALSKKNIAKAHDRNRIKRLLRETFRLQSLPAVDIVVLARQGVSGLNGSALTAKLGKAWNKLAVTYNS